MSIVRILIVSMIAATTGLAASVRAAPSGSAHHPATAHSQADEAKRAACEKVWAVQKVRHGTRQAFVAACVTKG